MRASRRPTGFDPRHTPLTPTLGPGGAPGGAPPGYAPYDPYGQPYRPLPPPRRRGCLRLLWLLLVAILCGGVGVWLYLDSLGLAGPQPIGQTTPLRPTVTPIPGWRAFSAAGRAEIWLPDGFVGGDPRREWPDILTTMRAAGAEDAATADELETSLINPNKKRTSLVMFNTSEEDFGQNVLVGRGASGQDSREVAAAVLQGFFEANDGTFEAEVRANEPAHIAGYDAHRLHILIDDGELRLCQTTYVLSTGSAFWTITFTYPLDVEPRMRDVIDRSMASFTVLP